MTRGRYRGWTEPVCKGAKLPTAAAPVSSSPRGQPGRAANAAAWGSSSSWSLPLGGQDLLSGGEFSNTPGGCDAWAGTTVRPACAPRAWRGGEVVV